MTFLGLDRSTEINTQVAHFVRWSLRLKNEFIMEKCNEGYSGIGLIAKDSIFEATKEGFIKTDFLKRLKDLRQDNCIVAVQPCTDIIPIANEFPEEMVEKLNDINEKYEDFSKVNLDIGEQFLGEVLRRTKEILNYIQRKDGHMLYEALKVFYKFFAKDDGILQTNEL